MVRVSSAFSAGWTRPFRRRFFLWAVFIGAIVFSALLVLRGRSLALAISLIGALLLLPPITQALYITGGGIAWQCKYALGLFVCVMVGLADSLAFRLPELDPIINRRAIWLLPALWSGAQAYWFAFALKRYGVGVPTTSWKRLLFDPIWSPPDGTIAALVAVVVILAVVTVLLILLLRRMATLDQVPPGLSLAKTVEADRSDPRLSPPNS